VPEIVPFRLTQMLEAALGLTGVEGTFRANCEAVVGVLRKNKDILLMLLEVFVWDPLVEWTRGDFHDEAAIGGEERKGMELAVSLSLFASRVQEIRVPLQVFSFNKLQLVCTIFKLSLKSCHSFCDLGNW
jgi:PI-3-kinase-related kinase SMG-1